LAAANQTLSVKSRIAAVGLKSLKLALNTLLNMGIAIVIDIIITGITKLVNSAKEAKENLEQFNTSLTESIESFKEEEKSLNDLSEQYLKVVASTDDLSIAKEELQSIQDSLIEKYGKEAENIDLVTGKISEQIVEMQKLRKEQAQNWLDDNSTVTDPTNSERKLSNEEAVAYAKKRLNTSSTYKYINDIAPTYELTGKKGIDYNTVESPGWGDWNSYKEIERIISEFNNANINPVNGDDLFFTGTMEERLESMQGVYKELSEVWKDIDEDDNRKKWLSDMKAQITSLDDEIETYKSALTEYDKIQKLISNNNWSSEYTESFISAFDQAEQAKNKLLNASSSSDTISALQRLEDLKDTLYDLADGTEDGVSELEKTDSYLISQLDTFFNTINQTCDIGNSELKNQISVFNDTLSTFSNETFDDVNTNVQKFNNAINAIKSGESLNSDTVKELIDIDSSLAGSFSKTVDGYTIALNKLSASRKNYLKDYQKTIDEEIKSTQKYIKQLLDYRATVILTNGLKLYKDPQAIRTLNEIDSAISNATSNTKKWNDLQELLTNQFEETADSAEKTSLTTDNIISAYESAFDSIIDKATEEKEVLEEQKNILTEQREQLEEIVSQYETAATTVENYIEKQKSLVEDKYNTEIDAIKSANEERQESIDLQEKLNNLENAKKKKVMVYSEASSWHLETDSSAIQEAQQEYDNALIDKQISDLEKQRDAEIDLWDSYKQRWQDTVDGIKNADDEVITSKILGSDWTSKIAEQDTGVLNNFADGYSSYQNKLSGSINDEIEAIERAIESKEKQIEAYQDEQQALFKYVSAITDKNKDYLKELSDVSEKEMTTMEGRTKFLEDCKERARKALDFSDLSVEGSKSEGLYLVQYDGETVGVGKTEAEAEQLKTELYGKLIAAELSSNPKQALNKGIWATLTSALKSRFNIIKPYQSGGIDDYTGLANVHGTPNRVETIFNSAQGKKLYDLVANKDNLVKYVGNNLIKGIGDGINKSIASAKNIINKSNTNQNSTIVFQIDTINTTDGLTFMEQMNRYLKQVDMDRMVGRNR
jgi:DNA repair exonuclease SbcCD ATPase subunit